METIKVIVDWLENYGAVSNQVPGCVATHQSYEGIKEAYISALEFHIEGLDANEKPECLKGEYKLIFEDTTRALLYRFDGILSRSTISRATGINEKQLRHYMSGFRTARNDKREKIVSAIHNIGKELLSVV
jgi:hypothetical protein